MAISLGSTTTSLTAQAALGKVSQDLAKSYQRLSSGLRINQESDDAVWLVIASQLSVKSLDLVVQKVKYGKLAFKIISL